MANIDQGQQIDLASLSPQQLSQVKKQLDDEVSHLTSSYQSLRSAQQRFKECLVSIARGVAASTATQPLLVPLTASLYVPGQLASTTHVLVDVGTGFYVEKSCDEAAAFYDAKVEEIGRNVKDLEQIVNGKAQNLRVVEEVLRQKVLAGQGGAAGGGGGAVAAAA